jgi:hypothetical protein
MLTRSSPAAPRLTEGLGQAEQRVGYLDTERDMRYVMNNFIFHANTELPYVEENKAFFYP